MKQGAGKGESEEGKQGKRGTERDKKEMERPHQNAGGGAVMGTGRPTRADLPGGCLGLPCPRPSSPFVPESHF